MLSNAIFVDRTSRFSNRVLPQVAEALNASRAGQVVVSAEVWQRLAGTGWGSGPVNDPVGQSRGLRLLDWTPDPGAVPGAGRWEENSAPAGGGAAAAAAPDHGGGGALAAAQPSRVLTRRASITGGKIGPPPAAASAMAGGAGSGEGPSGYWTQGRAASFDYIPGVSSGGVRPGGR